MTPSGYGRGGYSGHGGIDRERAAAPPPLNLPPRGAYTPTRGGFDHPNVGVRPMNRDIPPPSASRAPYGEPIGNSSGARTYPDVGSLSLNESRSRSQEDDFQRQNGRGGPPAPPAGRYGDPEDAGAARAPMPRDADDRDYRAQLPPSLDRAAFSEGRQPPVPPAAFGRGDPDRSRDAYAPPPTSQRPSEVPAPPGYNSRPVETNIPPPASYNRPLDPRINAPVNPPAPRVNDRPSPPSQRNGYDAPPQRGPYEDPRYAPQSRYEEERRPPPSAPQYNDREPTYNAPRGGYNSPRNGYDAPQRGPYDDRNDYDNRRPVYEPAPRGYDAPRRDYDDRYGYDDRRGPPPPRGSLMDRPMYDSRRGPSNDYDNRRPNGYSNDRDGRPSYNPVPPRGGYGGAPSYGRERSPPNRGYSGGYGRPEARGGGYARSGGNDVPLGGGGNSRFANSGQNSRQFDSYHGNENGFRPTFGQKERAPRDYVPHERPVEEIFQDDKNHSVHDGAFLSQDADIEVLGSDNLAKVNCEKWDEMELHPKILENISKSGYLYPRKIQQYTIPYVFDNFDIMCQGETGSGKTAAFLIPTIHKFLQDKESGAWKWTNRPYCLIISPTRELANQLYLQAKKFAHGTSCVIERAYGEINVRENIRQVSKCDILIGCVGRLMHFMTGGDLQCQDIKMLIIDEADRLFGDQHDQKFFEIFGWLPERSKRQTLLFSATLQDRVIQSLANDHMKPDCINIMAKNQSNSRVTYLIYAAESELKKMAMLTQFLRSTMKDGAKPRCLVFVNQKSKTDPVSVALSEEGIAATTIHGDRSQDLREEALNDFQKGKKQVLVATDVCARGVDIYDMDYVVNMDLPRDKSTYIQRCGRTGRLKEGYAVSFYYEPTDRLLAPDIAAILENSHQASPEFLHNGVRPGDCGIAEIPEREQRQNMASPSNVSAASSTSTARAASVSTPTPAPVIHDPTIADGW
uniref:RNA helicase n=1 Tax=Panagrellus redivivus TaxID=6233 RepID=A0A7E4ZVY6_PANRE